MFSGISAGSYARAIVTMSELRVRSELLAVYLADRLGETLILNDPWTGKPYGRAEQGVPFSVGMDGKTGTPDDISLKLPQ